MVLRLTGLPQSLCTQRTLLTLLEKEVKDFELIPIDWSTGEHKRPPYTDRHPFGVIPFLEDDDFRVFESRAIARYLAVKYENQGTALVPAAGDTKSWALFDQWASVEYCNFHPLVYEVLTHKLWNPFKGLPSNESIAEDNTVRLAANLDIYNKILGQQQYMAGDEFSLIDIFYMPAVNMLIQAGQGHLFEERPNLKAWWGKVSDRSSWKKIST
ncbi:putative glutathione-S-transferase theta, GST [Bisporella sp. PMI_857]|nr:putative glutathione-S-transferase theta, GST [Bisporella sp. PMI_857]